MFNIVNVTCPTLEEMMYEYFSGLNIPECLKNDNLSISDYIVEYRYSEFQEFCKRKYGILVFCN